MTPAINCSPVSTTPPNIFSPPINCIDNRGQNGDISGWPSRPRPSKSATAVKVGQCRRYCQWNRHEKAHRHLTHPDQTKTAIFSFGGLRGIWSGRVGCLWMHGGSNDTIGGRVRLRRLEISPICSLQLPLILGSSPPPTSMVSLFLSPAINSSPVSLLLVIIVHRCCCHRR